MDKKQLVDPQYPQYPPYGPPMYDPYYYQNYPPPPYPYPYYYPPSYGNQMPPPPPPPPSQYYENQYSYYYPMQSYVKEPEITPSEEKKQKKKRSVSEKRPKQFRPKKNAQSNICNRVFSFLTSEKKSGVAVRKVLKKNQKKVKVFYKYMDLISKEKKKYMNRKYLGELCILPTECKEYQILLEHNSKQKILSIDEYRNAISLLIFHFLRDKCIMTFLTSQKISTELTTEHLDRRRSILTYLEEYVKPDFSYE